MLSHLCSLDRNNPLWMSAFVAILLASVVGSLTQGQVLSGSIVGNVTDASGSGIPGATVRVTKTQTNESRETITNDSGG